MAHDGEAWVAGVEGGNGSVGLWVDWRVVDEHNGANGGEQVPVTEVGNQFLVPALAAVGESCQEGGVE